MGEDILHSETTADGVSRTVWLSRSTDGGLSIAGQDLGELSAYFGPGVREYEWAHSISADKTPALGRALGGSGNADVVALVKAAFSGVRHGRFVAFCEEHAIPVSFWSRHGE